MLSAKEIEDQLRRVPLKFIPYRDPQIEWGMGLPMFVDTFNKILKENNQIPSQDAFVERYFKENAKILKIDFTSSIGNFITGSKVHDMKTFISNTS